MKYRAASLMGRGTPQAQDARYPFFVCVKQTVPGEGEAVGVELHRSMLRARGYHHRIDEAERAFVGKPVVRRHPGQLLFFGDPEIARRFRDCSALSSRKGIAPVLRAGIVVQSTDILQAGHQAVEVRCADGPVALFVPDTQRPCLIDLDIQHACGDTARPGLVTGNQVGNQQVPAASDIHMFHETEGVAQKRHAVVKQIHTDGTFKQRDGDDGKDKVVTHLGRS
ncbi:hypothetical protein CXF96_01690 [Stenotrophomonas sp. Betaine-02u-21]|nr:hypothetical protein CXF90_05355 [Stenotrophomonas sp. Betaine-02u-23]PKH76033.1 hypothetical protein CXF96_01690 [Stenotrophomonas sp. Betaine-02u-21]PKH96380.1 hypothetical protein CXG43_07365 [Stenotrophomonas sp. Bg11-02]